MVFAQLLLTFFFSYPQPTEDISDEVMFPMSTKMSSGGAESDGEAPRPRDDFDLSSVLRPRLIRSSSDPSINTGQNIPGIPPYP